MRDGYWTTWALRWQRDGLALLCDAGPWSIIVADIEVYDSPDESRGTAQLTIHRWATWGPQDYGHAHFPSVEGQTLPRCPGDDAEIFCASADEARAVLVALLGVRGVPVPPWPPVSA
jgi:hypothetical protein